MAAPPPIPPRTLVATWLAAVAGVAVARLVGAVDPTGLLAANVAGVAAVLFVWLPDRLLRRRGEGWEAYGAAFLHGGRAAWREAGRGALRGLAVAALVLPSFALAFWAFAEALPGLPPPVARALAPYAGTPAFAPRLPDRFLLQAVLQLLVVALPEELFYRGFLQTALARGAPGRGRRVLGATLGRGFLWTQALFAVGHLVTPQPWRLGTFFPALLFGWLRERTGGVAAPAVLHALSNLALLWLEASFYR